MVSHEAPRLTDHGPVPYPATTPTFRSRSARWCRWRPRSCIRARGFIKLEDTVVVTEAGHEIYGEGARGWNKAGTAASARYG